MKKIQPGFTLIELLVVITIIAVLSGVAMISFSAAGKGARDARRKSDLETIRQALVMYRSDEGCYPGNLNGEGVIDLLLNEGYLTEPEPRDPKPNLYSYIYTPGANSTDCLNYAGGGVSRFEFSATMEKDPAIPYTVSSP